MPAEVFANAPAGADTTLTTALASAAATSAVVGSVAGLPVADPTLGLPSQWRGVFLNGSGQVLERFICTDSRTTTLTLVRQAEDATAYPAAVWPVGTAVAHELSAGAMATVQQNLLHKWRRHASASAQAIPASVYTAVTLDVLDFDSAGIDSGATSGVATCKRAGLYSIVWGGLAFNIVTAGTTVIAYMGKNGDITTVLGRMGQARQIAPVGLVVVGGGDLVQLAVGDTLTLYAYVSAALSVASNAGLPYMAIVRDGD